MFGVLFNVFTPPSSPLPVPMMSFLHVCPPAPHSTIEEGVAQLFASPAEALASERTWTKCALIEPQAADLVLKELDSTL